MAIEYPRSGNYDDVVEQLTAARNEIHRLNRHLAQSEDRANDLRREYRKLSHYAQEVLFTADSEGRFSYVAEGVQTLLGYEPKVLVGRRLRDIVVLSSQPQLDAEIMSLVTGGIDWTARQFPIRSSAGKTIPTLVVAMRLEGQGGGPTGLVGLLRDISEYSEKETELRLHADILNAVADSARRFLRSSNWRDQVPGFLEEIASAARVCRAYLYENFHDLHGRLRSRLIAKWIRRKDPAQPTVLAELSYEEAIYQGFRELLKSNTEVIGVREESSEEVKRYLETKRIRAVYILPVFVDEQWWGFLGFDEWYNERAWSPTESQAFRTAVRILGAAIRQSETSHRLRQTERLTRVQRDIAMKLSSATDIDEALHSVANGITGFEMRTVAVRDSSAAGLRAVHRGWPEISSAAVHAETARIVSTAKPGEYRYFSRRDLHENDTYRPFIDATVRSLAVLPVSRGARTLGVILLGSAKRDYVPTVLRETLESTAVETAGVLIRLEAEQSAQRNRERLHEANERYALATNAGRVGVWDYRRGVGFHISALLETVVQKSDHFETNPWPLLLQSVPGRHRGPLVRAVRDLVSGRADEFEIEVPLSHGAGELLWFSFRANSYRGADGRIERIIGTATDISSQKQLEERLRRAREESESLNRAKSAFLAHMSHELKTPLNGIVGYAQVLQRNKHLTSEQRDAIDVITRSAGHLLRLIDDVLDASRLESGRLTLQEREFNLPVFLQDLSEIVRIQAREKGLRFSLVKETNLPVFIRGDEKRLRQVLLNLLNNAIRFTETGSVSLCAGWYEGSIRFSVKDTGIGIPDGVTEEIFQPFYQVRAGAGPTEGSGLGLSITRQLLELMGQELYVESEEGVGTEAWFLVPHREEEDAWDLATTEEYIAPLEDIDMEQGIGLTDEELDELDRLARLGDVGAMEALVRNVAARSRSLGPIAERVLRYLREFRIGELKEFILSLKRRT